MRLGPDTDPDAIRLAAALRDGLQAETAPPDSLARLLSLLEGMAGSLEHIAACCDAILAQQERIEQRLTASPAICPCGLAFPAPACHDPHSDECRRRRVAPVTDSPVAQRVTRTFEAAAQRVRGSHS